MLGRPGRRFFEPSYFLATSRRYQRRDRIGCHDAGDLGEAPSAEGLAFHGQTASLIVGEANPLGTVRCTEDSVLLAQVVNNGLLLSIDPA